MAQESLDPTIFDGIWNHLNFAHENKHGESESDPIHLMDAHAALIVIGIRVTGAGDSLMIDQHPLIQASRDGTMISGPSIGSLAVTREAGEFRFWAVDSDGEVRDVCADGVPPVVQSILRALETQPGSSEARLVHPSTAADFL